MSFCFLQRDGKHADMDGKGDEEELGGIRKCNQNILHEKETIFNKRKETVNIVPFQREFIMQGKQQHKVVRVLKQCSQPVGLDPFGGQTTTRKHRYSHYNS